MKFPFPKSSLYTASGRLKKLNERNTDFIMNISKRFGPFGLCTANKARRAAAFVAALTVSAAALAGCKKALPEVTLSVWCPSESVETIERMIDEFTELHSGEAAFHITVSEEEELSCKETVLANPAAAADIYSFADDQFLELYNAGALLEVTLDADTVIAENGGADNGAIRSATVDGKLYAYPVTASNGYFLYYNSAYLTEDDVKSLDRILQVAEENGKKFAMDFTSGWYIYSFFKGAGLDVSLNEDGLTNSCNWNSTDGKYKGTDVAEAMLRIAQSDGFLSCGDEEFSSGAADGTVIAGVNGTWNAVKIQEAYGENYAATKLPEYTVAGDSVQMCSFAGYKLMGVNSSAEHPEWAMMLAQWLTNEENQMTLFRLRGEGPSNVKAAASEEVQAARAIAALGEQSAYGYLQNVGGSYWTPTDIFGNTIAAGNPDGTDLQELLDTMVKGITSPPENAAGTE